MVVKIDIQYSNWPMSDERLDYLIRGCKHSNQFQLFAELQQCLEELKTMREASKPSSANVDNPTLSSNERLLRAAKELSKVLPKGYGLQSYHAIAELMELRAAIDECSSPETCECGSTEFAKGPGGRSCFKCGRPDNGQTQLVSGGPIRRLAPSELRRIRKRQKAVKP
jgi:hypothetical protein